MDAMTKIIGFFSPQSAVKRAVAIQKLQILNSGYSEGGASYIKKALKGWRADSLDADRDIHKNLPILRNRSRSLYMNSSIARGALNTIRTNAVGGGLKLKSRIDFKFLGLSEKKADEWKRSVEREFSLWAESKHCDTLRLNNFYELQQMAQLAWLQSGDCFALLKYRKQTNFTPYGLNIHIIEADRVKTPIDRWDSDNIISGVEIDSSGATVAYWIANKQDMLQSTSEDYARVEAFGKRTGRPNILQLMEVERPEQRRGVPLLAPVIEQLKQLTRYSENEITASVIASMFTVFVKDDSPPGSSMPNISNVPLEYQREVQQEETELQLAPGMINFLSEGKTIEIADPKRPSTNFDAFFIAMVRQIGSALEVPAELLLKAFNSNYSASRAALLEAWKMFKMRRQWFASDFCQPIFEQWLFEAVASGRIEAKGFFGDPAIMKAWCRAEWNGPTQGQIDPLKEVKAAVVRVENGFSTRESEAMELTGTDFDSNADQLRREQEKLPDTKGGENNIDSENSEEITELSDGVDETSTDEQ